METIAPQLLRLPEVLKRTGMKRSTLYRAIQQGHFVRQVKIGPRCSAWRADRVDEWILKQINAGR